jgi:hypothetical protein
MRLRVIPDFSSAACAAPPAEAGGGAKASVHAAKAQTKISLLVLRHLGDFSRRFDARFAFARREETDDEGAH